MLSFALLAPLAHLRLSGTTRRWRTRTTKTNPLSDWSWCLDQLTVKRWIGPWNNFGQSWCGCRLIYADSCYGSFLEWRLSALIFSKVLQTLLTLSSGSQIPFVPSSAYLNSHSPRRFDPFASVHPCTCCSMIGFSLSLWIFWFRSQWLKRCWRGRAWQVMLRSLGFWLLSSISWKQTVLRHVWKSDQCKIWRTEPFNKFPYACTP